MSAENDLTTGRRRTLSSRYVPYMAHRVGFANGVWCIWGMRKMHGCKLGLLIGVDFGQKKAPSEDGAKEFKRKPLTRRE